ncbi:MAG: peptidase M28, partial [Sediminibacterium sp.]|nr:peptidase M28 [Sediminibacterium sp.]
MKKLSAALLLLVFAGSVHAQNETIDSEVIKQIRKEGLEKSQVMDIAFQLTDVSGNRLTNSPGYMRAAQYAAEQLRSWG